MAEWDTGHAAVEHRRPLRCRRRSHAGRDHLQGLAPRERALDLLMEFPPVPRDYEEVLRDRRVLCHPPAEHPSGARAPDPDTRSKKRASGLHVLLLQAGQVA